MCAHRALRARLSFPTSFPEGDPEADDPFSLGGIPHCRGLFVQSVGLCWGIGVSHRILTLRDPLCGTGQARGRPPPKGQDERRGLEMRCDCTQQPLLQDKGTPLPPVHKSCSLFGLEPECSPVFHLYLEQDKAHVGTRDGIEADGCPPSPLGALALRCRCGHTCSHAPSKAQHGMEPRSPRQVPRCPGRSSRRRSGAARCTARWGHCRRPAGSRSHGARPGRAGGWSGAGADSAQVPSGPG